MQKRKNLILKVLILLGIVAILVSSYVQYGIPYLAEQEKERNDERRIADLDALEAQIAQALSADSTPSTSSGQASSPPASSTASTANPNTVYISLPSATSTCADLELPSLPDGWIYHCAPSAGLTNSDGTGWLPINFDNAETSEHSNILENVGMLPIDPINSADTLNYYAFVATSTSATDSTSSPQATTEYVVTAVLDSKKYLTEKAQTDGGSDPIRYEVGHRPKLWSDANGLIGYWPINEGTGSIIGDRSKYNNFAEIQNAQNWENGSLNLDGDNYIKIDDSNILDKIGQKDFNYTLVISFKSDTSKDQSITEKWIGKSYPFSVRGPYPGVRFAIFDGKNNPYIASEKDYSDSKWHQVIAGRNTDDKSIFMYIDGNLIGTSRDDTADDISNVGSFAFGARDINGQYIFNGNIKDVYILNKTFTPQEVERIYSSLFLDYP